MMEAINQQQVTNIDSNVDSVTQQSINDVNESKLEVNIQEDLQTDSPNSSNNEAVESEANVSRVIANQNREEKEEQEQNHYNNIDEEFETNSQCSQQSLQPTNDLIATENDLDNNNTDTNINAENEAAFNIAIATDSKAEAEAAAITQQNYENTLRSQRSQSAQIEEAESRGSLNLDSEDAELLEKDDYEEEKKEENSNSHKDISLEKENELLKSDDDENEEGEVTQTRPEADECNINDYKVENVALQNSAHVSNKEVVTISDDSLSSVTKSEGDALSSAQLQMNENQADNSNLESETHDGISPEVFVQNEVINIDDDSQDNGKEEGNEEDESLKITAGECKQEIDDNLQTENFNESGRRVYKFVIDDSSQESNCKTASSDNSEENTNEPSSVHEDKQMDVNESSEHIRNCNITLEANSNDSVESIKHRQQNLESAEQGEMSPLTNVPVAVNETSTSLVKINGDHKSFPISHFSLQETDSCDLSTVDDIPDNKIENEPETETTMSNIEDVNESCENNDSEIYGFTEKPVPDENEIEQENDLQAPEGDDDSSRCSSLASSASSSTDTSSSHQLVIDHPMEEIDGGATGTTVATEPSVNVKLKDTPSECSEKSSAKARLKRKRSDSREMEISPKLKHPHVDFDGSSNDGKENILKQFELDNTFGNSATETLQSKEETLPSKTFNNRISETEPAPLKSLLLQHLQKPHTPPLPVTNSVALTPPFLPSMLQSASDTAAPSKDLTIGMDVSEDSCSNTKYLCFKCKTGSFDSFAALNEHQRECLADMRLLPTRIPQITNSLSTSIPSPLATPPTSASPADISVPFVSNSSPLVKNSTPTALPPAPVLQKKRYYKCSSCGTFHENWNLFLHIREKHQRHMCMYCIRFFPTAEKLSVHLEIKHDLEQIHFNSEEALRKSVLLVDGIAREARFLMCCNCQHLFEESEPFSDHNCAEFMKPCTLCGQKGRHSNQCKAHPDAKRSSKAKKKSKKAGDVVGHLPSKSSQLITRSEHASHGNSHGSAILNTSIHCDNIQNIQTNESVSTMLPPTVESTRSFHSEDSNSSSNMVIDESCTTTHGSSLVNPFKELDERWRMEQQTQANNEAKISPERHDTSPMPKLIVPKFKLRVPKEFQKSVDAAISTTDTDDDEEDEDEECDDGVASHYKKVSFQKDISNETTKGLPNEADLSQRESENNNKSNIVLENDESLDEPNSNLERILQEIERTKMDIQRTKKTLHHAPKAKHTSTTTGVTATSARNWTPTPPSSPKLTRWSTSAQIEIEKQEQSSQDTQQEPTNNSFQMDQRRDSAGSDVMDIDETITASAPAPPPREEAIDATEAMEDTQTPLDASHESSLGLELLSSSAENMSSLQVLSTESDQEIKSPSQRERAEIDVEKPNQDVSMEEENQQLSPSTHIDEENTESCQVKIIEKLKPADGIEVANDDTLIVDLQLDRPLEKFQIVEFVRICLKAVYPLCLYCNHARRIAVNAQSLVLHMIAQHRFSATVDSITAEELKPDTIVAKLKSFVPILENDYLNSTSYCTVGEGAFTRHFNERIFECFQCRFVTSTHKELYLHNRKMHLKTAILCFMCRANFFSFSEILCHICPGAPNKTAVFDVKFRCCLCDVDNIPSPFRLMVHLRKRHFACDVCLEDCRDQSRLSSHVWKHKLHHLCYRCGIAYRNKMDITKHLFWKHGTESIICKRCLQKRWRHVYHFCVPPTTFVCDICNLCFSKAMYLNVHKRLHSGDLRYPCNEENCEEKFISRRLLLKHSATHQLHELPLVPNTGLPEQAAETLNKDDSQMSDTDKENKLIKTVIEVKQEMDEEENKISELEKLETSDNSLTETKKESKSELGGEELKPKSPKNESASPSVEKTDDTPRKKRKKSKRSKESLEDLNLTAPNLSESDSSDDSDTESKSRGDDDSLVPKVMLSPLSETENDKYDDTKNKNNSGGRLDNEDQGTGKVLEIWKNFLQAQGAATGESDKKAEEDYTEDNYPTPSLLHVVYSDHDYCQMFQPPEPSSVPADVNTSVSSPVKRNKMSRTPRHSSTRRSDASSSSSESSSSSYSSCSCGSNCSCSSSGSDSSSSSSSSDDSDSSAASNVSRKRHRKKSERDRARKKSESVSPLKKHTVSESVDVVDDDINEVATNTETPRPPSPPKEPQIYESDLETAESETDEEFYDEHPQKLASELLAQKRAQLMAQTRLSPSHNYDIVENSRPSTPSLPEDVACEAKVKLKKKKRDRKSCSKASFSAGSVDIGLRAGAKINIGEVPTQVAEQQLHENLVHPIATTAQQYGIGGTAADLPPHYDMMHSSPNVAEPPMAQQPGITTPYAGSAGTAGEQLTPRPIVPHLSSRMSEGSSCSDADGSLKRSKRARRPNKFYGYTSDDEGLGNVMGQPLVIGMRAIKPQPPPQLTWRKEDLPTPSKSIVNSKGKTQRTPKTPGTPVGGALTGGLFNPSSASTKRKRQAGNTEKSTRKRTTKKTSSQNKLPPIPTLKIRPSQLGMSTSGAAATGGAEQMYMHPGQIYSSSKETDEDEDESSDGSSDDDTNSTMMSTSATCATGNAWNANMPTASTLPNVAPDVLQATQVLPPVPPPPPIPQTTVFNHKIPPALLPNPNFETLQYFKANNIRYPIRPPAGARQAREGESVYCYCRCPYDEVSEMIACDGENCLIEWFHFECVGIMVAPQGKWFCAECRPKYSEELYPNSGGAAAI